MLPTLLWNFLRLVFEILRRRFSILICGYINSVCFFLFFFSFRFYVFIRFLLSSLSPLLSSFSSIVIGLDFFPFSYFSLLCVLLQFGVFSLLRCLFLLFSSSFSVFLLSCLVISFPLLFLPISLRFFYILFVTGLSYPLSLRFYFPKR